MNRAAVRLKTSNNYYFFKNHQFVKSEETATSCGVILKRSVFF